MDSETMAWIWSILRRGERRAAQAAEASGPPAEKAPDSIEEWEARLVDEGVSTEWAGQLAERLDPALRAFSDAAPASTDSGAAAEALIRGAAVAVEMQADVYADVERSMRDVKEVERLLGAFSGELEKLDEVLEVLAAYAQRMRNKPVRTPSRTLH